LPRPVVVRRDSVGKIVDWLEAKTSEGRPATFSCSVSAAVRICLAAKENGMDISGTLFQIGGEPFTPARARVLESVGAALSFVTQ
jgi:hypothetical protein